MRNILFAITFVAALGSQTSKAADFFGPCAVAAAKATVAEVSRSHGIPASHVTVIQSSNSGSRGVRRIQTYYVGVYLRGNPQLYSFYANMEYFNGKCENLDITSLDNVD